MLSLFADWPTKISVHVIFPSWGRPFYTISTCLPLWETNLEIWAKVNHFLPRLLVCRVMILILLGRICLLSHVRARMTSQEINMKVIFLRYANCGIRSLSLSRINAHTHKPLIQIQNDIFQFLKIQVTIWQRVNWLTNIKKIGTSNNTNFETIKDNRVHNL